MYKEGSVTIGFNHKTKEQCMGILLQDKGKMNQSYHTETTTSCVHKVMLFEQIVTLRSTHFPF